MMQEFFGVIALALSLLTCFAGVYFTIWAGALTPKMPGLKIFGYAATAMAVFGLVFTSYCLAQTMFMERQMQRIMSDYRPHGMYPGMKQDGSKDMKKHKEMMNKQTGQSKQ